MGLKRHLGIKLNANLGGREIFEEEFDLLRDYWLAIISEESRDIREAEVNESCNEIDERYFTRRGWDRGIRNYNSFSGIDLEHLTLEKLKSKDQINILDIGYGGGTFLSQMKSRFEDLVVTYGIAPFKELSDSTKELQNVNQPDFFRLGVAEVLPREWKNNFDIVTCFESSMYFFNPVMAFNEALETLGPEGNLFYGQGLVPKLDFDKRVIDKNPKVRDYTYIFSFPGHICDGTTYRGSQAVVMKNFQEFGEYMNEIIDKGKIEKEDGMYFLKYHEVSAWCPHILQVKKK